MVTVGLLSFTTLFKEKPIVAYELVMKCRDPNHKLFGRSGEVLKSLALLEADGQPHDVLRDIVLSATSGDGLQMALGSPLKD